MNKNGYEVLLELLPYKEKIYQKKINIIVGLKEGITVHITCNLNEKQMD